MVDSDGTETAGRAPAAKLVGAFAQLQGGGNDDGVGGEGLGLHQEMVHGALAERRIAESAQRRQEIDEQRRRHRLLPSPAFLLGCLLRVTE